MSFKTNTTNTKHRVMLSGVPNSGKSTSLATFVSEGEKMNIVTSPGEAGAKSLLPGENITSYVYEVPEETNLTDIKWCQTALKETEELTLDLAQSSDVLAFDGLHAYYNLMINVVTEGAFSKGEEFSATLFGLTARRLNNFVMSLYHSKCPLIVVTCWEDWESSGGFDPVKFRDGNTEKKLWPSLVGKMSKEVVGLFDTRLSCRLEVKCLHNNCELKKDNDPHHVWQFLPRGVVAGVGIKGLTNIPNSVYKTPWIHQDYQMLKAFIERYK